MIFPGKRSKLALVAAGASGAAVAGFGLAFGRDVYNKTKKNIGLIALMFAAIFCPFIGGRGLVRGHDRGVIGTLFLTFIGSVLLIVVGFGVVAIAVFGVLTVVNFDPHKVPSMAAVASFVLTATAAGTGFLVGLFQRPKRLKAFAVRRSNEKFLEDNGFRETDGTDITHYDPNGQPLRFLETHPDRLVFMVVGRRGKRAYINLDREGRMLDYSGVQ